MSLSCGKVGHIKPACLALKKATDKTVRMKGKNVKIVQESAEQHSMKEYNLFNMKAADQRKPYTVLELNRKPLSDGN